MTIAYSDELTPEQLDQIIEFAEQLLSQMDRYHLTYAAIDMNNAVEHLRTAKANMASGSRLNG